MHSRLEESTRDTWSSPVPLPPAEPPGLCRAQVFRQAPLVTGKIPTPPVPGPLPGYRTLLIIPGMMMRNRGSIFRQLARMEPALAWLRFLVE